MGCVRRQLNPNITPTSLCAALPYRGASWLPMDGAHDQNSQEHCPRAAWRLKVLVLPSAFLTVPKCHTGHSISARVGRVPPQRYLPLMVLSEKYWCSVTSTLSPRKVQASGPGVINCQPWSLGCFGGSK